MNRFIYEQTAEGRSGGHPLTAFNEYLLANGIGRGTVSAPSYDFLLFANSLGNMRGTVYPFQDGGIRYAGPIGWVTVVPEPAE